MTTKAFRAGKRAPNTVFELSDVSALSGLNGDYDGQQASLSGWHPNSTVGGGILAWNPTRAKSDHNGSTVFSPTVPWTTTPADYLKAAGETDPAGFGAWERVHGNQINLMWFGVVGDGSTDDQPAIQLALQYVFENQKLSLKAGNYDVRLANTLYMPFFASLNESRVLDFTGIRFLPDESVSSVIESGKLVGGQWVTAMNDPQVTNNTFNTILTGLNIIRSNPETKAGKIAIRLKDWHQNCEISNVLARNFDTCLDSYNNFYLKFENLKLQNAPLASGLREGSGFIFRENHNLNYISQLLSVNTNEGYRFEGLVTAVYMVNISFEAQTTGMVTTGEVRGLTFTGSYGELNELDEERFFDFQGPVFNVNIDGNYFVSANPNLWVIKSSSQPRSAIMFGKNNNLAGALDETRIFETKGYGYRVLEVPAEGVGGSLSNYYIPESDAGVGTVVEGYVMDIFTGNDTYSIANVNSDIIPANYSGRVTRGFNSNRQPGMFDFVKDEVNGELGFSTKILYSNTQVVYMALQVNDFVSTKTWRVQIVDNIAYNFDGTVNGDITASQDGGGFLQVNVSGIAAGNPFNVAGGEIRVI